MKHALGLHHQGRRLPAHPDDTLLAAYPNSGVTWLQFLVANLIHPNRTIDFSNVKKLIIDPTVTVKRDVDRAPRPRIVKTHRSFDPRYRRVIYLVRDPRDVTVAKYEHLQTGRNDLVLADFIERFLRGNFDSDLGSWGENVASWLAARSGCPDFLLLRYEDLIANTESELMRVADFAGWTATPTRISQAIERSRVAMLGKGKKAPNGEDWQKELPKPQVMRIEAMWGDIMTCLGYECATHDSRATFNSSLIGLLAAGIGADHRASRDLHLT